MAESVGGIQLDLGINQSAFNKQVNSISGMAAKAGAVIGAAFAVNKLVQFGKSAIELGSNLWEVQNVVDVTFRDMASHVNQFAKSALESFGISELSAKQYTSTMGAMLKSMGFTINQSLNMSEAIAGLTGDMASFYNITQKDMFEKIRSGMSGETEPLKQLGINMSVANLEAFALSQGMNKAYQSMSQQEQTMLRYNYLLSVTADAQGDFARTSNSWANQTRILTERFNTFKATLGQGFINIFTPVLSIVNALIGRLQTLAEYFRAFTEVITGQSSSTQQSNSQTQNAVAGTQALAGAQNDLADATKKAGKEAKGALAGFDEVNSLALNSGGEGDIGPDMGGIGGGAGAVALPEFNLKPNVDLTGLEDFKTKISGFINGTKEVFATLFKPFKESWELYGPTVVANIKTIMEGLVGILGSIGQTFYNIWSNPAVQEQIISLVGIFSDLFTILTRVFDEMVRPDIQFFFALFDPTKNPAMQLFLDSINLVLKGIKGLTGYLAGDGFFIVQGFLTLLIGYKAINFVNEIAFAAQALYGLVAAFGAATLAKLVDKAETIILMGLYAKDFIVAIGKTIVELGRATFAFVAKTAAIVATTVAQYACAAASYLLGAAIAFLTSPIGIIITIVAALTAGIIYLWNTNEDFRNAVTEIWSGIQTAFQKFDNWLTSVFNKDWSKNFGSFGDIINGFFANVDNIWKGIKGIMSGIIGFITGVFSGDWGKAWDGIVGIFKGIVETISAIFKVPINSIISMINGVVSAINGIRIDIPDWVPGALGGKSLGFNIAKIPYLAKGGIIDQPTLAMVGERGKEAVVPLEDTSFVDSLASAVASAVMAAFQFSNKDGGDKGSEGGSMEMDGTTFARVIYPYLEKESKRRGTPIIKAT